MHDARVHHEIMHTAHHAPCALLQAAARCECRPYPGSMGGGMRYKRPRAAGETAPRVLPLSTAAKLVNSSLLQFQMGVELR